MSAIDSFEQALADEGYAERTIYLYVNYVRRAMRTVVLDGASRDQLAVFVRDLGPGARRQARKSLAAYYRIRTGRNPALELAAPPEPNRLPRPLNLAQYEGFLGAAASLGDHWRVVGQMLGLTGCRFSELRSARWDSLELSVGSASWTVVGKGARRRGPKLRVVPLHPLLVPTLVAWQPCTSPSAFVLPGEGGPVTEYGLRKAFRQVCVRAGLGLEVTPHRLRHTVGTLSLQRTNDLRAVQELLGHASIATTQLYTLVLPGRLEKAVGALMPDQAA